MSEEKVTFRRICEPLCGMVATVEDDRIVKLRVAGAPAATAPAAAAAP